MTRATSSCARAPASPSLDCGNALQKSKGGGKARAWFFRQVAALAAVTLALSFTASPARADESIGERAGGPWPVEKKVVVITLTAVTVGAMGYSVYSFARARSLVGEQNEDFPRSPSGVVDCGTPAQCNDLRSIRRDMDAWGDRLLVSTLVTGGAGLAALATAVLWPNGHTHVSAAPMPGGATVGIQGSF